MKTILELLTEAKKPNKEQAEYILKADSGENIGAIFPPLTWFNIGVTMVAFNFKNLLLEECLTRAGWSK